MKQVLQYFKNYKWKAILAPLFKMLEAAFELLVPLVMAAIIDNGIAGNDKPYIYKMAFVMVGLGVIGLGCSITAQYFSAKTAMGIGKEIRYDLFKHIETLSYTEIDKLGSATLITRMTSDVNQVQTGINMFLRLVIRSPFIVFGATIMAFTVNAKASRVFFITLPVLIVIVFGIMLVSIPLYKKVQSKLDTVTLKSRENLSGVRVIRAFNQEKKEKEEFAEVTEALTRGQLFVGKISSFLNPLTYAVINLSIVALIWGGAKQVDLGILKQGQVYALVNYMSQILVELIKLANLIVQVTKAVACGNRIADVLSIPSKLPEKNPKLIGAKDGAPEVEFDHVCMTYEGAADETLTDISFTVQKGQTIGIIGGTGSGKSSLVNLIPRFYDATKGTIRIQGNDINDYDAVQLRDKIGVVMQKAVLFAGTIADNLRWGKNDATEEEMWKALDIAQATEVVKGKEGGLDYMIEQGGKNLSGGQKQRLTIARAVVKDPDILILDDSASALDFATDASLRAALKGMHGDKTIFIVSQRTSSIQFADNIIVLDDGQMVGFGPHEKLLETCETYKEIYDSQFKKESDMTRQKEV